jgi:hypothetical protein
MEQRGITSQMVAMDVTIINWSIQLILFVVALINDPWLKNPWMTGEKVLLA